MGARALDDRPRAGDTRSVATFEYRRPRANKRRERGRKPGLARPEVVKILVDKVLNRQIPRTRRRLIQIQDAWPRIVPARVANRTMPRWIERDTLVVVVHDNQWLHELRYMRQAMLDRLQENLPEAGIAQIELRLARRRPGAPGVEPPEGSRPDPSMQEDPAEIEREPWRAPLPESPSEEVLEALHSVKDPALRDQLAATRLVLGRKPSSK